MNTPLPADFQAFVIHQDAQRKVDSRMERMTVDQLDAGEVLIRVAYSSVNYKDALAATGAGKIIRRFPCVGGIDLSGTVVSSADSRFKAGDPVIATSFNIGVSHHGGYAEYVLAYPDADYPANALSDQLNVWNPCASTTANLTAAGQPPAPVNIGEVNVPDGRGAADLTMGTKTCHHVLAAASNVLIDVLVCGPNATQHATDLTAKITGKIH